MATSVVTVSNTFFQLFEGDAAEYAAYAAQSVTPMFFIKQADTLYGPVAKEAHEAPAPAEEAAEETEETTEETEEAAEETSEETEEKTEE